MRGRHLAGTEAVQADAVLQIGELGIDLGIELGHRHENLKFVPEALGESFIYLHDINLLFGSPVKRPCTIFRERARTRTGSDAREIACRKPDPRSRGGAGGGTRTPTTFV